MSIKSKVIAATAALGIIGGLSVAGATAATTAKAATPSCGPSCLDLFSREFGTHHTPNYVLDVYQQGAKVGQKIIMWRTSNSDPAEDFSAELSGSVSDFYAAGLVSSSLALHYGCTSAPTVLGANIQCSAVNPGTNDPAFELEYSPYGRDSGLCVGVARTATAKEGVTLQSCGTSARTVWVVDANDSPSTIGHGYLPLINGSDLNFSHPFVLQYPANGFPTDTPRPQVFVNNLTGFSQGNSPLGNPVGNVDDDQLWGAVTGILK